VSEGGWLAEPEPRRSSVVILRAFIKKTERTPAGEIDLAVQRAKELKP